MSERSVFTVAALASAAMPSLAVASTRESEQVVPSAHDDIDVAVVTDTAGREFDVNVSDTPKGKKLLLGRANTSAALLRAKEPAGLGFALERTVAFQSGEHAKGPTAGTAVLITVHNQGFATPLDQLTESQCVSVGTAIGAIHRLRPAFLEKEGYPSFSASQIRRQLVSWIKRLKEAGHVPDEITSSWEGIVATEGLWSFHTCPVHGGFDDGDMLFSSTGLNAVYHWNNMQVNDPARDLAWIFDKLDAKRRNNVLSAYARLIGSRLDDLIMLRASLWLQMEQVGDFIRALDRADNDKIIEFKAQVERLAHQLSVRAAKAVSPTPTAKSGRHPSTITVGTLLEEDEQQPDKAATAGATVAQPPVAPAPSSRSSASRPSATVTAPAPHATGGDTDTELPSSPESKTAVVETPDAKTDETATITLPALTPEDFDDAADEADKADEGTAAENNAGAADSKGDSDTADAADDGRPSGYISLVSKDTVADANSEDAEGDGAADDTTR